MKIDTENINGFPKTLYKFRDWSNEYNRRLLVENELYLANNFSFNDPFDLQLPILFSGNFQFDKDAIIENVKKSGRILTESQINELKEFYSNKDPEIIEDLRKEFEETTQEIENRLGVFCMSERNDSSLMWGHYANSHKGFCVGFDTEKLQTFIKEKYPKGKGKLHKVEYSSEIPVFDLSLSDDDIEANEYARKRFYTKFNHWSYEDEIRIIVDHMTKKDDKAVKIPKEIFKEIIFGSKMSDLHKKEIRIICDFLFPNLKYFKAIKNKDKFEMDIIQIK